MKWSRRIGACMCALELQKAVEKKKNWDEWALTEPTF